LPTFTDSFWRQGWIWGPEARAARAKSIDGSRMTCGALTVLPQGTAGEKGAPQGAPTRIGSGSEKKNGLPARTRE